MEAAISYSKKIDTKINIDIQHEVMLNICNFV